MSPVTAEAEARYHHTYIIAPNYLLPPIEVLCTFLRLIDSRYDTSRVFVAFHLSRATHTSINEAECNSRSNHSRITKALNERFQCESLRLHDA